MCFWFHISPHALVVVLLRRDQRQKASLRLPDGIRARQQRKRDHFSLHIFAQLRTILKPAAS